MAEMATRHIVDSSVWVALFLDFDTQHARAVRTLERLLGVLYVPYCIVAETVSVLAYKHSKTQADNFLRYIADNVDITIVAPNIDDEIAFYATVAGRLSFADSVLIVQARKLNAALVTFDEQLARVAKKHMRGAA